MHRNFNTHTNSQYDNPITLQYFNIRGGISPTYAQHLRGRTLKPVLQILDGVLWLILDEPLPGRIKKQKLKQNFKGQILKKIHISMGKSTNFRQKSVFRQKLFRQSLT